MSEMVERVAKAICQADGDHCVWPDGCGCAYRASKAIAALREPTRGMQESVLRTNWRNENHPFRHIWNTMIDAALAE